MCELSDEELVENFTSQFDSGGPTEEQMRQMCRGESSKILGELNRMKLEKSRCQAEVALSCAGKQEAAKNCNSLKNNPQELAQRLVSNVCRRFAPPPTISLNSKLYEVANKWYDKDPALANQLGTIGDETGKDKKERVITDYLFGNGDYGAKQLARSADLRKVRDRIASSGVNDSETLALLDTQIKDLDDEGKKFTEFFNLSRIGGIFG